MTNQLPGETGRAERALHRRAGLACGAAVAAGVPGRFRVWEESGLLAVAAGDPALGFLSTVSGVGPDTVGAAVDLVSAPVWGGTRPAVVVSAEVGGLMSAAGLTRGQDRVLAVRRLDSPPAAGAGLEHGDVVDVLLAGYQVDGVVAAFIRAEHRHPAVRGFLVSRDGVPVAAGAMTVHGDVAVLGGASTLPAHRGRGAQSLLLRHRLRIAADEGCALAVATALPGSTSAANLVRAGFRLHRRSTWTV